MPTISVIVPIYKVEPYLRQCVDSILGQTFRDFELILVDDGSPDGCPAICDEYAKMDSRVKVIHKENGGLSSARNVGLDVAKGEYIAFVDSDDWIHLEYLEQLMNAIQSQNADMSVCNIIPSYPPDYTGWKRKVSVLEYEKLTQQQMADRLTEKANWFYVVAWNKLYRRGIWDRLRFPEGFIHEDEAVIHRVIRSCQKIAVIPEPLYYYRQLPSSITGQGIGIQSADKLFAFADRIAFSSERNWIKLSEHAMQEYIYAFFELYYRFTRTDENEKYFRRMDDSLKKALPYILKSQSVSLRHKVYLTAIRVNPQIYAILKRLLKG